MVQFPHFILQTPVASKKTSGQRELLTNAAKYNTCICIKKTHSGTNIVEILQNLSMD